MGLKSGKTRSSLRNLQVGDALPDSVILLPDSGDLNNFSGDTGDFVVEQSATATLGDNWLRHSTSTASIIWSNSGLDNYPGDGDTFRLRCYLPSGASQENRLAWGEQGSQSDALGLSGFPDSNTIKLERWGGSVSNDTLDSTTLDFDANGMLGSTWECEMVWSGDQHSVDIYDGLIDDGASVVGTLSGTDPLNRSNGGIKMLSNDQDIATEGWFIV